MMSTPLRRLLPLAMIAITVIGTLTVPSRASADPAPLTDHLASPVWLCRPGMVNNPCNQDIDGNPQSTAPNGYAQRYPQSGQATTLDATRIASNGSTTHEPFAAPQDPAVDCFYVYPTVDLTSNPVLQIGSIAPIPQDNEMAVTMTQVGRFSGLCRMYVPVYRQAPLASLALGLLTGASPEYATGAMDIEDAWNDYWANDNIDPVTQQRRGVVLIGHSQGTADLVTLMQNQFDGQLERQQQLVSAILLGGNVQVPTGQPDGGGADAGSTFQHLPACERDSSGEPIPTGCVVAYSSYNMAAGQAPAATTMFGHNTAPGHQILCTNPAGLLSGAGPLAAQTLDAYLPTNQLVGGTIVNPNGHLAVVLLGFTLPNHPTGFARHPGRLTGQCRVSPEASGTVSWLQVDGGDALFPASTQTSDLGLHVVDFNVALGDLVELASAQAEEWLTAQG